MKKIYLLTGSTGSGKTTRLKQWIDSYKKFLSVSGILSPVLNGKRYFKDIVSGEIFPMESPDEQDSLIAGRYYFSKSAFEKARMILEKITTEWIIIDEFGLLEWDDKGLNPVIRSIINSRSYTNLVIVIRESLVKRFLEKYSLQENDYEIFNFQRPDFTASILAGGESKRMGREKALLKFGDFTVIELLIGELKKVYVNINIISNSPESFLFTGQKIFPDIRKGFGPLSGMHSAIINSQTEKNLIVSCDMPFLNSDLFTVMSDRCVENSNLLIREKGFVQPFPGIYSASLIDIIENNMKNNRNKQKSIYEIVSQLKTEYIDAETFKTYSSALLFNVNSPDDYKAAQDIFDKK